jgi:NTP pyrophosphatase (non-canonical NTP hydrolase)
MDFNEYQLKALETAMYPNQGSNMTYPALGLAGESGEICEKVKDDGSETSEERDALAKELGDVLWYVAMMAAELSLNLSLIAGADGMDIGAYQREVLSAHPKCSGLGNAARRLAGQSGKVCDKVKKMYRDDGSKLTDARRKAIAEELNGVLRYMAVLAAELGGNSLEHIAEMNIDKLASRKRRGTITGDGDDR